jgi:DsbC/DsbD-like thiol-disulfide interchange protein
MKTLKIQIFIFLLAIICNINAQIPKLVSQNREATIDYSKLVKVKPIAELTKLVKGDSMYIAFEFEIEKHWHIYWKEAGDSGLPTRIEFDSTQVFQSDIIWQKPEVQVDGIIRNYVYSGKPILFKKIKLKNDKQDSLEVEISWLVCKDICIPQSTKLKIPIKVETVRELNSVWKRKKLLSKLKQNLKSQNIKFN